MSAILKGYRNFLLPILSAPNDASTSVKELFDLKGKKMMSNVSISIGGGSDSQIITPFTLLSKYIHQSLFMSFI